jgi:peptide/nickel transport system permease protein
VAPRLAAAFLLILILSGLLAHSISPFDPDAQSLGDALIPPMGRSSDGRLHTLGTDFLGRDVLSRMIYGARVSLAMAATVVMVSSAFGTTLGLIAGYSGGFADNVVMRMADVQLALPFMLLAIAVMAALGPGLDKMILVLVLVTWAIYARIARGQVLAVKELDFVLAARSLGASTGRILMRHILPNILASLIVVATLESAQMIVAEAALSYLGLGVRPPTASWGSMLADGRNYLYTSWWLSTFPGVAIFLTVLCINVFGSNLRERMDPRLRKLKRSPASAQRRIGRNSIPVEPADSSSVSRATRMD